MSDDPRAQLLIRRRTASAADRVVTGDEAAQWPEGLLVSLLDDGTLEAMQPAVAVECDQCPEGHVEVVQFVEEPLGSPRRAYIGCPAAGRVLVDTSRMRQWRVVAGRDIAERTSVGGLAVADGRIPGVFDYTDDYRCVKLHDEEFKLSERQAMVVRILHEAYLRGKANVGWPAIATQLASSPRNMAQVFRDQRRWRLLIKGTKRALYRLNLPA